MVRNTFVKEHPSLSLSERPPPTLVHAHEFVGRAVEFFGSLGLIERLVSVAEDFVAMNEEGLVIAEALLDITIEETGDLHPVIVFLLCKSVDEGRAVFADPCRQLELRPRRHPLDRVVYADVTDGQAGRILVVREAHIEPGIHNDGRSLTRAGGALALLQPFN